MFFVDKEGYSLYYGYHLANSHIQVRNTTINQPSDDDSILMKSASYNPTSGIITFD